MTIWNFKVKNESDSDDDNVKFAREIAFAVSQSIKALGREGNIVIIRELKINIVAADGGGAKAVLTSD